MADVVSDSAFPDRIGIAGGPLIPCRVTEFSITTAPTATVREYYDGGVSVRDQAAQHVIRYEVPHGAPHPSPAPERIEASWMTGAGEVRIAAIDLIADPRPDRTAGQRLEEAIRARLDGWLDDICGAWRNGCPVDGHAEPIKMRAALLAVLDRHAPRPAGIPGKPHLADCSVCLDVSPEVCSPVGYPCETVEDIAKELGVEVDDGG